MSAASPRKGAAFLVLTTLGWGLSWPINKALVDALSPWWAGAMRSAFAAAFLLVLLAPAGRLVRPPRADVPALVAITVFHLVAFTVFTNLALQVVPVGRSAVLAYSTPLWVMPAAALLMGERLTPRRLAGLALGLAGLVILMNPMLLDWTDRDVVVGHLLLLAAALFWAVALLIARAHRWSASPFSLLPWQIFVATAGLCLAALAAEGPATLRLDTGIVLLLVAGAVVGLLLPYWGMVEASRHLSAGSVSLGMLGVPLVSTLFAALLLGQTPEPALWLAMACVVGGIALGTWKSG